MRPVTGSEDGQPAPDSSQKKQTRRYKGLVKNAAQVFTLIGLTNLYRVRRRLLA